MSKVLVDRDALEKHVTEIDSWNASMEKIIGKQPGYSWASLESLREAISHPAEAEGVEAVEFWVLFDATTPEPYIKKMIPEGFLAFFDHEEDAIRAKTFHPGTDYKRAPYVRQSDHLAALSAVTAERDRLQRNLNFTEQWYATRFERLADLGKSAGCWDVMAAIIANGTADQYEPPTYAQQLVRANHRAAMAERERDQLRAELDELALKFAASDYSYDQSTDQLRAEVEGLRKREALLEKLLSAAANYATKLEPMSAKLLNAIDAAMAAKEV